MAAQFWFLIQFLSFPNVWVTEVKIELKHDEACSIIVIIISLENEQILPAAPTLKKLLLSRVTRKDDDMGNRSLQQTAYLAKIIDTAYHLNVLPGG